MATAEMRFTLVPLPEWPMRFQGGEVTKFKPTVGSFYGHLGCSEKSEFTNFAVGLDFVSVYTTYRKIMDSVDQGGAESHLNAFKWLSFYLNPDGSRNMERCATRNSDGIPDPSNSAIPFTLDEAWIRYRGEESAENQLFGCLLYIADETFQRGARKHSANSNEPLRAESSARIYADLQKYHGWVVPIEHQTSDTWRNDRVLPPGLRPECVQNYGEHTCERWNRIWHCLKMVDYYKTPPRRGLMCGVGQNKDFDKPDWWRTIYDEAEDERDEGIMIEEALARFQRKRPAVRQLECIWRFASDQVELCSYLDFSDHQEYAKQLQKEQNVPSPCKFRDADRWNSRLGQILKFIELKVDILEVQMLLFDENGFSSLEERPIFNEDEIWTDEEIEEAFDVAQAKKAVFTVTLIPGVAPKPVKFEMSRGLGRLLEYDEETGVIRHRVSRMLE